MGSCKLQRKATAPAPDQTSRRHTSHCRRMQRKYAAIPQISPTALSPSRAHSHLSSFFFLIPALHRPKVQFSPAKHCLPSHVLESPSIPTFWQSFPRPAALPALLNAAVTRLPARLPTSTSTHPSPPPLHHNSSLSQTFKLAPLPSVRNKHSAWL